MVIIVEQIERPTVLKVVRALGLKLHAEAEHV
jgi:hypothetical protein